MVLNTYLNASLVQCMEQPLSLCPLSILPNSHPHWLGPYMKQPKLAKAVASDCETQCRFSKIGDFLQSMEQVLK